MDWTAPPANEGGIVASRPRLRDRSCNRATTRLAVVLAALPRGTTRKEDPIRSDRWC
jgi:hypothetical protein